MFDLFKLNIDVCNGLLWDISTESLFFLIFRGIGDLLGLDTFFGNNILSEIWGCSSIKSDVAC